MEILIDILKSLNDFIKDYQYIFQLINIINMLFWFVYVIYTVETFKQIKKQTDLASEAFLVLNSDTIKTITSTTDRTTAEYNSIFEKWSKIIKDNIPDALSSDEYLVLKLSNRGKSDIQEWHIELKINVEPGEHLNKNKNIFGDNVCIKIPSSGYNDYINASDTKDVVIGKINNFPIIHISWHVVYTDIRGINYSKFGGDNSKTFKNILAFPNELN